MHLLYFHQHFTTPKGSTGTRSYEMARELIAQGHKVTMVCGNAEQSEIGLQGPFVKGRRRGNVDGIDVIEFDLRYSNHDNLMRRSWTFIRFALGTTSIALSAKYDKAFATTTPLTVCIPVIIARWLRRKPYVFEVRDLWPELPKAMGVIKNPLVLTMLSILEWLAYRNAERCIGLSPGIVEGIRARGVNADRIAMISNGCDNAIFDAPRELWRPDNIGPEKFLAIFTGTHGEANGLDAVLDAASVLKRIGADHISIALVGEGKRKPHLIARAAKEGLDNVHFHPPVSKERIAGLMASADVGLQILANIPAFYYGTSPNKFFDYLSAGLPVLVNYPGWVADLVTSSNAGVATAAGDPEAFADALVTLSKRADELACIRENAKILAKKEFDRAALAQNWINWVIKGKQC